MGKRAKRIWVSGALALGLVLASCAPAPPPPQPEAPTHFDCGEQRIIEDDGMGVSGFRYSVRFQGTVEGFGLMERWDATGSCDGQASSYALAFMTAGESDRCPQPMLSTIQYRPGGTLTNVNGSVEDGPYTLCIIRHMLIPSIMGD